MLKLDSLLAFAAIAEAGSISEAARRLAGAPLIKPRKLFKQAEPALFNGPPPTIHSLKSEGEEATLVGNWTAERAKAGVRPPPQSRR
jgi:hypothetical protein